MRLRPAIISAHRWLSLAVAALWLVQALTGIFSVFHWEIDDALVEGAHVPTDFAAMEKRLAGLPVGSIWTSAGAPDRYDVYVDDRTLRVDGAGNTLREGDSPVTTIVVLHQSLLAGSRGRIITGTSGILLLTNIAMGLIVAWPRAGQWLRAMRPRKIYGWHRALGLWLAIPAFFAVAAGAILAFEPEVHDDIQTESSTAPRTVGMAQAANIALARYPGAVVSGIGFPSEESARWTLTIRQRGEWRRAYGKTRLWISAVDGRILGESNALETPLRRRFIDSLFAFHAGETFGFPGRLLSVAIGVWLIAMIGLGVALFLERRRASQAR